MPRRRRASSGYTGLSDRSLSLGAPLFIQWQALRVRLDALIDAQPLSSFLDRLSRLSLAGALLLTIVGAWWLAGRLARDAEQAAIAVAYARADSDVAAAAQLAQQAISGAQAARYLAQRWIMLDPAAQAERRAELELGLAALVGRTSLPMLDVGVADAEGRIIWRPRALPRDANVSVTDTFHRHHDGMEGPLMGRPVLDPVAAEVVIPVTWRLRDAGGGFAGTAMVAYRPAALSHGLAAMLDRSDSVISLLRDDGILLARSQYVPELIGQTVVSPPLLETLMRDGVLHQVVGHPVDGRRMLLAARRLTGTNLMAFAALDEAVVLEAPRNLEVIGHVAAAVYSVAVLLAMLIGFGLVRTGRLRREAAILRAGRAELTRLHRRLPAVIYLREIDADGTSRIVYNAGDIRGVTGWGDGELEAQPDWDDYVAADSPDLRLAGLQALRDGSAELRWTLRQPDGSSRSMVSRMERLSLRGDGGGEVVGYVRDVSEEQLASEREAAARRELDRTLALAPVVVMRARVWACTGSTWRRGNGCYREDFLSHSLERVTGWTPEALAAHGGLASVLDPWDGLVEGIEAMRRNGEWAGDFHLRRPDGESILVRLTTNVVGYPDAESMDIVGYIADVTAERDAKARVIGSARLASLGELAAGLAHELKQPIQAIELGVSNAQNALKRGQVDAVSVRLERISGYTRRAGHVIEHLRRLSRGADEAAAPEPVPVAEAVEGALSIFAGPLRDAGVEVVVEFATPAPVVMGQAVALEQVLINLLANARDAMAPLPDDAPRKVWVRAAEEAGRVSITVADTAGGIPAKVMARLFEPFFSTKGLERGTGLGLSICQSLIRHMGGTICAHNECAGAVFSIDLPSASRPPEGC